MGDVILRMENIDKVFGTAYALRNINFELCHGEVHALLGENGVLTGFETVFEFMLMGKNYEYFTSAENSGEDIVTISGAKGYNEGLVPLLEALGITAPDADAYTGKTRAVKLLRDSLDAILERIDGILHSDDIISEALAIVP